MKLPSILLAARFTQSLFFGLLCFGLSSQLQAADTTPPQLRFTYPADGMLLVTNWPSIRGVVTDETGGSGVSNVTISIMAPDGTFWNGSGYGPEPVELSTVITDGTNWSRSTGIPVKTNLQMGNYVIFADAYDVASNLTEISITVTMNVPPPPPNDDFADAELIAGTEGSVHSTTTGATREPGEPLHAFVEGNASIWYKWVAPEPGFLLVHTLGSTIDTIMGIYTGSSVSNLVLQDGNDDGGELGSSRVEISVAADTTYYIAIDGKFGFSGSIVVNWEFSSLAQPRLRIRLTNSPSAGVVVSWPAASTGFTLESTANLQPGGWAPVSELPSNEGDQQVVILPLSGSQRLFRLQKPQGP
jgi:hypothetical protein